MICKLLNRRVNPMNREEALRDADLQRSQAWVLTHQGELARAQQVLEHLTTQLQTALAEDEGEEALEPATSRAVIARTLADAYGMLGGVEWRRGRLTEAGLAYARGREIEQSEEFGISDSYNLVNSIVVSILRYPAGIDALRNQLELAAAVVKAQVEGERRDQWWAWADYALLTLLIGDEEAAINAYDRFANCGPRLSDYQSVKRVLQSLVDALMPVKVSTATKLIESIDALTARTDVM
jgi:tetratricopeptide (TPR) repeat protein